MHATKTAYSRKNDSTIPFVTEESVARELETTDPEKTERQRKSRAKPCLRYEAYIARTKSESVKRIPIIAAHYPNLTPHQLRIAALMTDLLTNMAIAGTLGVTERAVERVRQRIRKGMHVDAKVKLPSFLVAIAA